MTDLAHAHRCPRCNWRTVCLQDCAIVSFSHQMWLPPELFGADVVCDDCRVALLADWSALLRAQDEAREAGW